MLSYDDSLGRVRADMTAVRSSLGHDDTGLLERSLDQIRWTTVRGGSGAAVSFTARDVDDYEFTPGVTNYYRLTPGTGSVQTDDIAPVLDSVWLKDLARPFLNMKVKLAAPGDITRASRSATFDVIGRNPPVAVTMARGLRQFDLVVKTATDDAMAGLAALLDPGDVLLLQVPSDYPAPLGGYYLPGDAVESRNGGVWQARWTTISLTEAAAPGPDIIGGTITWAGLPALYASWDDLSAAVDSWNDLAETVGAPGDVVVT
jgi:hypothetical protein